MYVTHPPTHTRLDRPTINIQQLNTPIHHHHTTPHPTSQTYLTTLVPGAPVTGAFPITTVHLALIVLLFPFTGHLAGA